MTNEYFLFWKNKVRLSKTKFLNFCFLKQKISKNDLKQLRINKMLQKLIYSIFVFMSSKILIFKFLNFWIIFGRTCYGTTVYGLFMGRTNHVTFH